MKKRLFIYTIIILSIGLVCFFTASFYIVRRNSLSIAENRLIEMTQIYAGLFNNTDIAHFVNVGQDSRITVISAEGYVLADSRPLYNNENRISRPEIQAALNNSPAVFTRRSNTLGVDYIYYALKVYYESGDNFVFVRVSISVAEVNAYLYQSLPLLAALLLVLALASFFSVRGVVKQIIIGSENNKLAYILNSIGDGLFVVDESKTITLANAAALRIFGAAPEVVNKHLSNLTNKKKLTEAVTNCIVKGNEALLELKLKGNIYLITIRQLPDTNLTMVALTDVTENRENAMRREEFFTNASHELKTPLTAIKGFNELMALGNKDENIQKYIDGITRETSRLMALISSMLKLSEVENAQVANAIPISLAEIISDVSETISTTMAEKFILFETKGDATILSDPLHIYEVIKNLIENAVKYNSNGGKVSAIIEVKKKKAQLIVSDNGIGISTKNQTRIFERFYRVDKSRTVLRGGTGLGLSIVKHICVLYGWKLSLKSKLGAGTDVVVEFDKVKGVPES